jgi:hypothetical protein
VRGAHESAPQGPSTLDSHIARRRPVEPPFSLMKRPLQGLEQLLGVRLITIKLADVPRPFDPLRLQTSVGNSTPKGRRMPTPREATKAGAALASEGAARATMGLKYVDNKPGPPFVLAGEGKVAIGNVPTPTSKALLAMGDNSVPVTQLWGTIFGGFLANPSSIPQAVMQRLRAEIRQPDPLHDRVLQDPSRSDDSLLRVNACLDRGPDFRSRAVHGVEALCRRGDSWPKNVEMLGRGLESAAKARPRSSAPGR